MPADKDAVKAQLLSWFETAMRVSLPFLIGVAGYTFTELKSIDKRVTVIERDLANADGPGVKASLDTLRVQMAVTQQQLTQVATAVDKIDRKLEGLP